jgi:hypothetical protein
MQIAKYSTIRLLILSVGLWATSAKLNMASLLCGVDTAADISTVRKAVVKCV